MIEDFTNCATGPHQQIHHQTLKNMSTGPKMCQPSPSKVSDAVAKCHWYVEVVFRFWEKAMVKYHQGFTHCHAY